MKEVRKTIIIAALAAAFLDLEARLPIADILAWLVHWPPHAALLPG
jgi:hypothetical protein